MKLYAYKDSLGFWTIGIGRMIDRLKNGGITVEEAKYLLANDIAKYAGILDQNIPWWRGLTDGRQEVLLNMVFNMGWDNPATPEKEGLSGFKNTLAAIQSGDYAAAAAGMRQSKWAKQVGKRAERLAKIMETD